MPSTRPKHLNVLSPACGKVINRILELFAEAYFLQWSQNKDTNWKQHVEEPALFECRNLSCLRRSPYRRQPTHPQIACPSQTVYLGKCVTRRRALSLATTCNHSWEAGAQQFHQGSELVLRCCSSIGGKVRLLNLLARYLQQPSASSC